MSEPEEPFTPDEELLLEVITEMVIPQAIIFSDIAFSNPLHPQYCAQFLHGVWFRLFASEDEGAIPAAFHFIVFGRTDAQMASLVNCMSRCHCASDNPHDKLEAGWIDSFHDFGAEAQLEAGTMGGILATPTHFHSLMQIVSTRILQILKKTNPVKLAKLKGRQEWPASLYDIILPSTSVVTILQGQIDEATGQLLRRLGPITSFFHDIFSNSGGSPGMLDNFPVERKTAIVQMCGRVIELLRSPLVMQHAPKDHRTGLIRDFTGNLTLFLDVGVSADGIDPTLVQQAIDTLDRSLHAPPITLIRALLVAWKQSLRCYAMLCEESLQSSHTFKRCSMCKVVSYCGPECQRRAWRDHKPLCKTITKIIRDGGGDLHSEAFRQNCDLGKVDAGDAEQVVAAFTSWRTNHGRVHL
ncbi:hypothetical protein B0H13DRAFT_2277319 [Mycena leptocephala]|nr:hypothetical protein B0H13DRAFT_2277319 [Mycena leptocephala]